MKPVTRSEILRRFDRLYPRAKAEVDGRVVRSGIDNVDSIRATLSDYAILPGVRVFPTEGFAGKSYYYSAREQTRVEQLAEQIRWSGEISPIIIVEEQTGPYVLEGGHRMSALVELGAKAVPAMIVIDLDGLPV